MLKFTAILLATSTVFCSFAVCALDFSFSGRTPDMGGHPVQIEAGVEAGVRVVFDTSSPERTVLRPAHLDETANNFRSIYRFEWQADKSARFYELVDPSIVDKLSQQNVKDTASPEGKAYEIKVIESFFAQGKVLQTCLPRSKPFHGSVTALIVVGNDGRQEQIIVLPEGGVAECITKEVGVRTYPTPPSRFTAKANIRVTE